MVHINGNADLTQDLLDTYRTKFKEAAEARNLSEADPDNRELLVKANILRNQFRSDIQNLIYKALSDDSRNINI